MAGGAMKCCLKMGDCAPLRIQGTTEMREPCGWVIRHALLVVLFIPILLLIAIYQWIFGCDDDLPVGWTDYYS